MAQTLHEVDEETDVGAYRAYLGAQSDGDLFDIMRHLDPERYPARLDAAQREFRRRRVLSLPAYTSAEYAIRYAALFAFVLTAITAGLTLLLTPEDAAGPPWLSDIPNGTTALEIGRLMLVSILRGLVNWDVHLGLYDISWAALGLWVVTRGIALFRRQARADVWQFAFAAWLTLTAAMLLAGRPDSAVPTLFHGGDEIRPFTLWNPFD
jgi:hypothetical protein